MVRTVRLDKKENYLLDKSTGNIVNKYDPDNQSLELIIKLDSSMLKVDASAISIEYGGQIVAQYNNDKFIIDDGYRDTLIKAGYIVYKDYDEKKEHDKDAGIILNDSIISEVRENILSYIADNANNPVDYSIDGKDTSIIFNIDNYSYTCSILTVENMVNKNLQRKDNSLPYYPFEKNMDKYGTLYVAIFAKKISKYVKDANEKYNISGNIISSFINQLGSNYHYISLPVKKKVINWKGI